MDKELILRIETFHSPYVHDAVATGRVFETCRPIICVCLKVVRRAVGEPRFVVSAN